jgi:O-antigen biosynthesis protein
VGESLPDQHLPFTGERFVPGAAGVDPELAAEHLLRYAACRELVRGRHVVDVACGSGYGAAMLADSAAAVVGVDVSSEAIDYATAAHAGRSGLSFVTAPATRLPFDDESVDVVVSFETVEHLAEADQARFSAEVLRVLKRDGLFVVSTPNKPVYGELYPQPNPFHLHELDEAGFRDFLAQFTVFAMYHQALMTFAALWSPEDTGYALRHELVAGSSDSVYLVAVVGRDGASPPDLSLASLWYDSRLNRHEDVASLSGWAREANTTIEERDRTIRALQAENRERTDWALQLERELLQMKATRTWRVRLALDDCVSRLRAMGRRFG